MVGSLIMCPAEYGDREQFGNGILSLWFGCCMVVQWEARRFIFRSPKGTRRVHETDYFENGFFLETEDIVLTWYAKFLPCTFSSHGDTHGMRRHYAFF